MKIIVTHKACDLDAVTSSWIINRFLPGWENAEIQFVPAGMKLKGEYLKKGETIEVIDGHEIIHVDTGLGPLDHHQTSDDNTCATSLALDYVLDNNQDLVKNENKVEALRRMVDYVVDDDHFQEVFYPNPSSDIYSFSIVALLHGIKIQFPKDDTTCVRFGMDLLDASLHYFENKIWAQREIKEKGIEFNTKWGKAMAIETINDTVLKIIQEMGYVLAVRKDPSNNAIRIKVRPSRRRSGKFGKGVLENVDVDLTPVYEQLMKMDSGASWFLHVSKRMLLNGSTKNPEMRGTKLTLDEVIGVLQNI